MGNSCITMNMHFYIYFKRAHTPKFPLMLIFMYIDVLPKSVFIQSLLHVYVLPCRTISVPHIHTFWRHFQFVVNLQQFVTERDIRIIIITSVDVTHLAHTLYSQLVNGCLGSPCTYHALTSGQSRDQGN